MKTDTLPTRGPAFEIGQSTKVAYPDVVRGLKVLTDDSYIGRGYIVGIHWVDEYQTYHYTVEFLAPNTSEPARNRRMVFPEHFLLFAAGDKICLEEEADENVYRIVSAPTIFSPLIFKLEHIEYHTDHWAMFSQLRMTQKQLEFITGGYR